MSKKSAKKKLKLNIDDPYAVFHPESQNSLIYRKTIIIVP